MNKEDYNKYYIQGSDHYLIPKDVFKELFNEMMNWKEETEKIKQKLNWIAFGDDPELALRYLRKIGYVDFDEERKVYINKHNNEPFLLDDEEEKAYYIKDEELNEYTKQLEYQNQELKKQLEDISEELELVRCDLHNRTSERDGYERELNECLSQQKEFIKYLEDNWKQTQDIWYIKILQKYRSIIGCDKVE